MLFHNSSDLRTLRLPLSRTWAKAAGSGVQRAATSSIWVALTVALLVLLFSTQIALAQVDATITSTVEVTSSAIVSSALVSVSEPSEIRSATLQQVLSQDEVTYGDLIQHYDRVTGRIFDLMTFSISFVTVLVAVGTLLGGILGYAARGFLKSLETSVSTVKLSLANIQEQVNTLEDDIRQERDVSRRTVESLRYSQEVVNPIAEVRIRAVQKLGASNDIGVVATLSELASGDTVSTVRAEAVYWLGQLLREGGEPETLSGGIQGLVNASKDQDGTVRLEAVQALDTLVCNNIGLPRYAIQGLRSIAKDDTSLEVKAAAQKCLEHTEQQREKPMNSQSKMLDSGQ